MTEQEIQERIELNKSVYDEYTHEIKLNKNFIVVLETHTNQLELYNKEEKEFYPAIAKVFPTKDDARHYRDNYDIKRVITLPYLTWEEFKKKGIINSLSQEGHRISMYTNTSSMIVIDVNDDDIVFKKQANKKSFYEAYNKFRDMFCNGIRL